MRRWVFALSVLWFTSAAAVTESLRAQTTAGAELRSFGVRLSWGHRSPQAAPWFVRLVPAANGMQIQDAAGWNLEESDKLADGIGRTTAGAGDVDGVEFTLNLVLVAGAADAAVAVPPTASADRTLADEVRAKGWIAYAARADKGDWDIFVCRPDGSHIRNLTGTPEHNEFSPQFSRDGRRLLYRRMPRTETIDGNHYGTQGELVLANSDGTQPQVFGAEGEYTWASWSPDGKLLACLSIKGIMFIDVATQQVVRKWERKGFFQQLTWSPDGRWLSGVANSFGAGWSTARMDAETGAANAVNCVDCCTPDWFPDSQHLVFSWRPPGQAANNGNGWTQLWMADAEGRSRRLLYAEDGRHVYGGHVSPDGKYLLFTGNMQEDGDPNRAGAPMGLMRLRDAPLIGGASRELRKLHPGAGDRPVLTLPVGWEPCWTVSELPAGKPARSSSRRSEPRTILISAQAPANRGTGFQPVGSRDGRLDAYPTLSDASRLAPELHSLGWLAFSAKTEQGDWDLFLMRPDGTDRQPLTNTPRIAAVTPPCAAMRAKRYGNVFPMRRWGRDSISAPAGNRIGPATISARRPPDLSL
jgi:hypothetical protein